ncbi:MULTISPECIES: major capsid protein [unclassified Bartonella]|uniref:major capsid protein n=1 Tax=unclassified Bartonella TaxID=2645622 RepID=UPI0035CE9261
MTTRPTVQGFAMGGNRYLSTVASAEPGLWRTKRTPYLREIMDNLSSYVPIEITIVMKGTQIGMSEAELNFCGYAIHYSPGPALYVTPTVETAKKLSKTRLDQMIMASPALSERIAKSDTVKSEEIQNRREFGIEDQLETAMKYIARKQKKLISGIELTWENMQLGAVQGVVLDADGSVIVDWYKEWEITPPKPIDFKLNTETTNVADHVDQVIMRMIEASKGAFSDRSRIIGLCGNEFFSKLKNHKTIRETYLNTALAQTLNSAGGVATPSSIGSGSFGSFDFAGVTFINYRSIHNYNVSAKAGTKRAIGIKPDECQFFPVDAPGVFQKTFAPGESLDFANTVGRPLYTMLIVDHDRNAWVKRRVYSYPLYICTRPEMLFKAVIGAK